MIILFLGLEIGSWAEWAGAITSLLAVLTALFLPYFSNKVSVKISSEPQFGRSLNSDTKKLSSFMIGIYNQGGVPFQITEIGLAMKGSLNIKLRGDFKAIYITPKTIYEQEAIVSTLKNSIVKHMGDREIYILQPYIIDGSGKRFTGKKIKIKKSDF